MARDTQARVARGQAFHRRRREEDAADRQKTAARDGADRTKQTAREATSGGANRPRSAAPPATRVAAVMPTAAGQAVAGAGAKAAKAVARGSNPEDRIKNLMRKRRATKKTQQSQIEAAADEAERERNESADDVDALPAGHKTPRAKVCVLCGLRGQGNRRSKKKAKGDTRAASSVLCARTKARKFDAGMQGGSGAPSEKYFPKVRPNGKRILKKPEALWEECDACSGMYH